MHRFIRTAVLAAALAATTTLAACNFPATATRAPAALVPGGSSTQSISLTTVGGITVNSQIAEEVRNLLSAAKADGLTLTGGGYRSGTQQIALRKAHCGLTAYAIYQMSSSLCVPPTARPGTSLHERGLAIDFSHSDSHTSAAYVWLAANAARYGLYNLPSEPWHWSTNGH